MLHDCVLCVVCYVNNIHGKVYMEKMNTRVITHNLGGSGKRMAEIVRDIEVY